MPRGTLGQIYIDPQVSPNEIGVPNLNNPYEVCATYRTTWALAQHGSLDMFARDLPVDPCADIICDLNSKGHLGIRLTLEECDISPRSCAMTPSDQNYVPHLFYT